MKLMTKNFRLNALANRYSAAVYNHLTEQSGGDWFPMTVKGQRIEVAITGGPKGIRDLVDSYLLRATKVSYRQWERVATDVLTVCLDGDVLTEHGKSVWQSMVNDMSASLAEKWGISNA